LCVLSARYGGAAEIVATDVSPFPLRIASQMGASCVIDVGREPEALRGHAADKDTFDVVFEASGNADALRGALDVVRPGAIAVQVGLGGDMMLPINTIVAREIQLRGTFRFDDEFHLAVELMGRGLIDVKPLITATLPFERAVEAFDLASDRGHAMKVQLAF